MLSYPSALSVSSRALITLTNALQRSRNQRGTRWRRLPVSRHALLALAHLRKGETYPDLLEGGVKAVSLHEGDRRVYGPMSLEPGEH